MHLSVQRREKPPACHVRSRSTRANVTWRQLLPWRESPGTSMSFLLATSRLVSNAAGRLTGRAVRVADLRIGENGIRKLSLEHRRKQLSSMCRSRFRHNLDLVAPPRNHTMEVDLQVDKIRLRVGMKTPGNTMSRLLNGKHTNFTAASFKCDGEDFAKIYQKSRLEKHWKI